MAFTLQTDEGDVEGANAYIEVSYLRSYHQDRGTTISANDTQCEVAIVKATDYLDARFTFAGYKLNAGQSTQWPRSEAYDKVGAEVEGIPSELKEACAEYAQRALSQTLLPDVVPDSTGQRVKSKSTSVGPISKSITYMDGGLTLPRFMLADAKLARAGWVIGGLGPRSSGQYVRN